LQLLESILNLRQPLFLIARLLCKIRPLPVQKYGFQSNFDSTHFICYFKNF